MKLFVTGGTGFVGQWVVRSALGRGHDVTALVRRSGALAGIGPSGLREVMGDVREPQSWERELDGVDAVIHLAAAKTGDLHGQFAVTVGGTERLLDAMLRRRVGRLVHVSTFSVYDYSALAVGATLDEQSPLLARPGLANEYAQVKLVQERLVRDFADGGGRVTVVRPGAVFGPGELWDAGLALRVGPIGIAISPTARQKLTYVENCADAIVLAAERPEAVGATINVVDDELPSQRCFLQMQRRAGAAVPRTIPVPYRFARAVAGLADAVNQRRYDGRAKLPFFFVPTKLDGGFRPLRYSNAAAKAVLGWSPRVPLGVAVARSVAATNPR